MSIAAPRIDSNGQRFAGLVAVSSLASLALIGAGYVDGTHVVPRPVVPLTRFLDVFPTLAGVLVLAVVSAAAFRPGGSGVLWHPVLRGAAATYAALILVVWNMTMQMLWLPTGLQLWGAIGLVFVVPLLYLAWWGFSAPRGGLRMLHAVAWMTVPLALLVAFEGTITPGTLSIPTIALGLGYFLVVVDRALAKAGR